MIVVVDLGTGSGAIGLAVAEELPLEGTAVWLTDASSDALDVARANLAGIGRSAANVRIAEGSWFDALAEHRDLLRHGVHVVVSNPPYVELDDPRVAASVLDWEPGVGAVRRRRRPRRDPDHHRRSAGLAGSRGCVGARDRL